MLTMNELVDLRMQQQLAHEIYRQQIMQRIPDPFGPLLPMSMPPAHLIMPQRPTLPGADAKLENNDLWQQFHKIGTEMIITKSGRRMFPSMRVSLSGLEDESQYCVLLEMVPLSDCRYKFSGSQWVPAGGAEPQSPQRMFLHPDSPATGAHWQAQAILFNKVKLTNNTLDNNGHIVLASMHKYQPRLHIIRTSDLTQLPWAPQQAFVFPETEFIAVTAYQNDRITKLKIDNNPFAKGFRETGQSRCKRKLLSVQNGSDEELTEHQQSNGSPCKTPEDDVSSISSLEYAQSKRQRFNDSSLEEESFYSSRSSTGSLSPRYIDAYQCAAAAAYYQHQQQQQQQHAIFSSHANHAMDAATAAALFYAHPSAVAAASMSHPSLYYEQHLARVPTEAATPNSLPILSSEPATPTKRAATPTLPATSAANGTTAATTPTPTPTPPASPNADNSQQLAKKPTQQQSKRKNFSISAILAC